ncbi:unnamed protein product [Sphenostylis stenocarpa]|uniref:Uncharacterized protein n=1 Tax=Sphenostylis stenocarpa TaxID=92480 RepID=A0AA86S7X8_9FABA|nr:unnamed protein product [Sphenostylis stenocarpa]CAJ1964007.1 unnamed protein product [Sphenostylis stenocarpa]
MACSPSLHMAILPWFATRHISSFLQLSNNLAERGHSISLFIPKHTHAIFQHLNQHPSLISLIPICVPHNDHHGLPHVAEATSEVPSSTVSLLMTPMVLYEKDIEVHLLELKPNIVLFDHAYWVPKPRLTRCLGIKSLVYYVISPSSLTCELSYLYPSGISEGYYCNITEHHHLLHEPKLLAGSGRVDHGKGIVCIERCTNSTLTQSYATGLKGCRVIEGAYVDYHRRHVSLQEHVIIPKETTCHSEKNWANWLGNFGTGSVAYCSIGSECTLKPCQFQELLLGLELSGMPFVASLRPPKGFECVESALPKGFKERVQGRGVVSGGSVPHQFILEHPSVGCFVTVCGYSGSLSEALVNKCQLVLLPNHGEGVFNARVIGNTLKVGVEVEKLKTIKMVCLPKKVCAKL